MSLQAETDFFHDIADKVRNLVIGLHGKASVAQYKKVLGDYSTEVDIAVEKLIISELKNKIPDDLILAEEGSSKTEISDRRIWIIDPICGTTNLGRGLTSFCTNIALADNQELIAACVIDHSQNEYFWSVGGQKVYINNQLYSRKENKDEFGVVIDVDFGALPSVTKQQKEKLADAAYSLTRQPGYMLQSLNTSLGFAYTAVNKIDGFINVFNFPWDICAASFLIQQSGGIITDLDGHPWELSSIGAIGAGNEAVHQKLLEAYLSV